MKGAYRAEPLDLHALGVGAGVVERVTVSSAPRTVSLLPTTLATSGTGERQVENIRHD